MSDPATPPDAHHRRLVAIAQPDTEEAAEFVAAFDDVDDVEVELIETTGEEEVREVIARVVSEGVDTIASVGGDGALNLVIGGLWDAGGGGGAALRDVTVVPVRSGTVNLVSKTMGLDSLDTTVDAIVAGRSRAMDVGRSEAGVFVLNSSSGYDAAVIGDAADHSDATLGQVRFAVEGIKRLRDEDPVHVTVRCDGVQLHDGPAMSVVTMNIGERASDDFHVAPDAEIDDGLLDVAVIRAESLSRFLGVIVKLALRRDVERRHLVRAQAEHVEIEWSRSVASQRDGDADDEVTSLDVRVHPGALRIHCA
ncbi:diacylglycerol/lipid kinase family protein [Ilumatobacter sp.]|uniref:diacylglycerol/lipid kinase family protein n=1 Tax=Ilumatobacter sp. TaxID=1967498 RepID=UPI003B520619